MGGKKGGGAAMIKISWVAVFDPQYGAIVSARLHEEPDTAVARDETQDTNFLTLVKRWLALDEFASFFKDRKATTCFNPPTRDIIHTLTIPWPVTFFQKYSQKKRKYINVGSDTKSGDPF